MSKAKWKTICIIALAIFGASASWCCVEMSHDYGHLNDSYQDEKAIADMMEEVIAAKNHEIADLNKRIEELEARIPQ